MGELPFIRGMHRRLQAAPQPVSVLARGVWRFFRPWITTPVMADHFLGIPGRIHHEDHLLDTRSANSIARYRRVGLEAYQHISAALQATGATWPGVRSLLDYGCGYGRVMRWIATQHPHVRLTAADTNAQAVQFCSREFEASPLVVERDVARLTLPASFDVIWAGSALTRLRSDDGGLLLAHLTGALAPGGVLLFTTHGELIAERLAEYGRAVAERTSEIKATLMHGGVAFLPGDAAYPPIAFHARASLRTQLAEIPACELVSLQRRGWDKQQDVWTVTRPLP